MHILILPSWYPKCEGDIGGSFFRDQAHALAAHGLQVGALVPDVRGPKSYLQAGRHSGIVHRLDGPVFEVRSKGFNWAFRNRKRFSRIWYRHALGAFKLYIKKRGKPDLVHVHSMHPAALFAEYIYTEYGIPFVITEHSTTYMRDGPPADEIASQARIVAKSHANLAVSPALASILNNEVGGNWQYLPNIVSQRFLSYPVKRSRNAVFRIVAAALLSRHKRMDLVIESVAELKRRGRAAELLLIGDGPERENLENLASALGLNDAVIFQGLTTIADMPETMASGDLLISASEFETFGVTLIEGMALGLPVVATRSGGPEAIITPAVGTLVEGWSPESLANAVQGIMDSPEKYRPADIRSHCRETYSEPVISSKLVSIYAGAASAR